MSQQKESYLINFLKKRKSASSLDESLDISKKLKLDSAADDENEIEEIKLPESTLKYEHIQNILIKHVEQGRKFIHEVALPPDMTMPVLKPIEKYAITFPFTLDEFQKRAILCIENNFSVLVSAHTSAGKTAIAEYAISSSLRNRQRVIYTTPIKALSNQKYREFLTCGNYSDVGLMTGDVTINPSASLLIMTTEILRIMIYRGSDLIREIGWAIFDEVHYMRDAFRGVVWEECISLLPTSVRFVFLSATIPNAGDFARWIVSLQLSNDSNSQKNDSFSPLPCHVIRTESRPIPLKQYLCVGGSKDLHRIINDNGQFMEENFDKVIQKVLKAGDTAMSDGEKIGRKGGNQRQQSGIVRVVLQAVSQGLSPIIVFFFNKRHCELQAKSLMENKVKLVNAQEKLQIRDICNNALSSLSDVDKDIEQIRNTCLWASRGIAVHHGGMMPLLKELVEILFSEGLIKVLFATETFAMGLNMPAKTIIFSTLFKFDGNQMRCITSSEYIQMSGRAGRRGRDEHGTVILMVTSDMKEQELRQLLTGSAECLNSSFRITYNMILNLMRFRITTNNVQAVELLMRRSFFQFQSIDRLPGLTQEMKRLEEMLNSLEMTAESSSRAEQYYELVNAQLKIERDVWKISLNMFNASPLLCSGRLVKVVDYGWCIIIEANCRFVKSEGTKVVLCCLVPCDPNSIQVDENHATKPANVGEMNPSWEIMSFTEEKILGISKIKMSLQNRTRLRLEQSKELRQSINESWIKVIESNKDFSPFNPMQDFKLQRKDLQDLCERLKFTDNRLKQLMENCQQTWTKFVEILHKWESYQALNQQLTIVKRDIDTCKSLLQLDELRIRCNILTRLGYCDQNNHSAGQVTLKGRVACEINSCDELLLTELLFDNFFKLLTPAECAAALSCLVFDERLLSTKNYYQKQKKPKEKGKGKKEINIMELFGEMPTDVTTDETFVAAQLKLIDLYNVMKDKAKSIAELSQQCRLDLNANDYVTATLRPGLMFMVFEWARGRSFVHVSRLNRKIFPGSIVRTMRRLAELIQQLQNVAQIMKNEELETLFTAASNAIKRDVVYCASLYV